MSEIKLLFCALAGCTSHKTVHPEIAPCTLPTYSNNKWLKKRAQSGCKPPKIVHPATIMCTPGAGCTLNFGHCGVPQFFFRFFFPCKKNLKILQNENRKKTTKFHSAQILSPGCWTGNKLFSKGGLRVKCHAPKHISTY